MEKMTILILMAVPHPTNTNTHFQVATTWQCMEIQFWLLIVIISFAKRERKLEVKINSLVAINTT
jgi:hypothetical protein